MPRVFRFRVTDSLLKISLPCSAQYLKIRLHCLLQGAAHKPSKICFCEATHLVSFLCCQRMKATLTCLNHGAPPNLSASPLLTCNRVRASATCIPDFRAAACYSLSAHPRPPYPAPRMICRCEPGSVKSWPSNSPALPITQNTVPSPYHTSRLPFWPHFVLFSLSFQAFLLFSEYTMFCLTLWFFHWLFFLP